MEKSRSEGKHEEEDFLADLAGGSDVSLTAEASLSRQAY